MTCTSSYVHALDGRLRIKVPEVKGCARRARDIEHQFSGLTPIEYVSANPVTGNVLFLYDAERTTNVEIVEAIHAVGYLREVTLAAGREAGNTVWTNVLVRATTEMALQKLITALI